MSFSIKFQQLAGQVTKVHDGKRDVFKVEWDDDTIDFLYKEHSSWKAHTVLKKSVREKIGLLIEKGSNHVLHQRD